MAASVVSCLCSIVRWVVSASHTAATAGNSVSDWPAAAARLGGACRQLCLCMAGFLPQNILEMFPIEYRFGPVLGMSSSKAGSCRRIEANWCYLEMQ